MLEKSSSLNERKSRKQLPSHPAFTRPKKQSVLMDVEYNLGFFEENLEKD